MGGKGERGRGGGGGTGNEGGMPFGSYDRHVLKQLHAERLDCVYTSDGGLAQSDAWLKTRQTNCSNMSEAAMKSLATGYPSLAVRLRCRTAIMYKKLRG